MRSREIIGLVILIVVVSAGVYSYMDYQEKKRERGEYEAWLQEVEAKDQAWDEEVAYYEEIQGTDLSECPGHIVNFYYSERSPPRWSEERFCCFTINEEYDSYQWEHALYDYSVTKIRNVTSAELREEIHELVKYGCANPRLGTYSPLKVANPANVDINIDSFERVIFLVRVYTESIDVEPFEGWLVVCWMP